MTQNHTYQTSKESYQEQAVQQAKDKQLAEDRKSFYRKFPPEQAMELTALPSNRIWPALQTYLYQMLLALDEQIWAARDMNDVLLLKGQRRAALTMLRMPDEMKQMIADLKGTEDVE